MSAGKLLEQAVTAGHDVTAVVRDPRDVPGEVGTVTADLAAAVGEVPRLAADLGHLLDELLVEVGPSYVRAGERRGLTAAQAHLLLALDEARGPLTLGALAHRTQRSVTSAGRLVEHLRRNHLVSSPEGTGEGHPRRVELT